MIKSLARQLLPKPVWAYLRSKRIKHLISSYEPKIRTGLYGGHNLKVSLQDPLAEGWYGQDWDFSKDLDILRKFRLQPGAKVMDLGAHQSVIAMILAKEVGTSGKVLSVEANKHNYEVGCDNKKLNNLTQLEPIYAAVGKTSGTVEFSEDLNGAIKSGTTTNKCVSVQSFSVDDLVQKYFLPDVIVMDIEGYEGLALEGASETLKHKIDWMIEVHGPEAIESFGRKVEDVLRPFLKPEYQTFMASETSSFVPLNAESPLLKERFFLFAHRVG